jgi:hypothetical protein
MQKSVGTMSNSTHRLNFIQANIKNINLRRLSKMSSPRDGFAKGFRGSTIADESATDQLTKGYTQHRNTKVSSRNTRSNSAQGDQQFKGLKKTATPEANAGKKKEIMKLTIMNPSFRNETVIYKNPKRVESSTPEKATHKALSGIEDDLKVFSSKHSAYSSVISKRRSKNERRLAGFGSFGRDQGQSFLAKINKQSSPI